MLSSGAVVLSRYEIAEPLGGGGFANAYLARDLHDAGTPVAVKESRATLSGIVPEDKEALERFRREAVILKSISSPHVVRYIADGEHDDALIIVMEFAGQSLNRLFARAPAGRKTPFDEVGVASILVQSLLGLETAYKTSCLAHRDLSVENLFLDSDGITKVGDFGIAKLEGLSSLTGGKVMGKYRYMAPECFTSPAAVDWRADIYALGVVAVLLLTGRYPLPDPGDDPAAAADIAVKERPQGPADLLPGCCSPATQARMLQMLAKDPALRCESVASLILAWGGEAAVRRICPECCALCEWEDDRCGGCGAGLEAASLGLRSPSPAEPIPPAEAGAAPVMPATPLRGRARLLILRGDGKEHSLDLVGETMELGRDRIDPGNRHLSRRHARLRRGSDGWQIEDAGSLNGIFVNAALLAEGEARRLHPGDSIKFAETFARFEIV